MDIARHLHPIVIPTPAGVNSSPAWYTSKKTGKSFVAFGSNDGLVYVVDIEDPKNFYTFEVGGKIVTKPAWHFDEKTGNTYLAICTDSGALRVLEVFPALQN